MPIGPDGLPLTQSAEDRIGFVVLCEGYVLLRKRYDSHSEWVFPRQVIEAQFFPIHYAVTDFVKQIPLPVTSLVPLPGTFKGNASSYVFCRMDSESLGSIPVWPKLSQASNSAGFGGVFLTWIPILEARGMISAAPDSVDRTRDLAALDLALLARSEPKPRPLELGYSHNLLLEHCSSPIGSMLVNSDEDKTIRVPFVYNHDCESLYELAREIIREGAKQGYAPCFCYNCVSFAPGGLMGEGEFGYCYAAEDPEIDHRPHSLLRFIPKPLDSCGRWQLAPRVYISG